MELIIHEQKNGKVAELRSDIVLRNIEDFVDLIGNANYLDAARIVIRESNLPPDFLDLKTKVAGEILQKFSTYDQKLSIIGDFSNIESKSLRDFIRESNEIGRIVFTNSKEEAFAGSV
ncbi:DUF4180 domain-containing protein [Fulvivirgaceae bacterium BMA12]|uniref:DUF4180 domain-containing protein n=1 Tax=Agaribacillus aureus TaxID=3051825 RepID=A0ABT8LF53_9BACT|nr:DUF4180 domain-containing protein [Fulvivirgaceae bacterium BMA12]